MNTYVKIPPETKPIAMIWPTPTLNRMLLHLLRFCFAFWSMNSSFGS